MKVLSIYFARFAICALACAGALRLGYGPPNAFGSDSGVSYLVVCTLLASCALAGWLMRSRKSRLLGFFSSAAIALFVSAVLIQASEWTNYVDGKPWQYFYKDDYILLFQFAAPLTVAVMAGLLSLIPERKRPA